MAKKKDNTIYYLLGLGSILYFLNKNGSLKKLMATGSGTSAAGMAAKEITANVIQNTTFAPVTTTDKERYENSLNNCK